MKAVLALALVASLAAVQVALAAPAEGDTYTSRFDSINLDEVLASDRLLKNYLECLMDRKPCTAEGTELKARIPEALQNECAKCTPKQKEGAEKVITFLMKNKADMWKELSDKYDPSGQYTKKYADRLEKKN
ncbi:allergen Tha p 1-like isoform X1 [Ischnura elegans]|uniref:allergen Tha p 1-like isoform X1 n=1 Tax=Ischnura elegans TaxID=197161 RepID=UPI001ED8B9C4|nr:allergen Tha p 1-like isoform X1 [Ischnura elegans]